MSQTAARDPIQDFVQSAAVHIRKTELFYSWMILLSVLLFSTFLFVLVDHWVWEINQAVRLLLWISLAVWSLWWFVRKILPPMRYRIHPEYAARQFELQDPRSKDSLISWIQLNQSASNAPKSVLNFVGRYAFGFLRNSDATQVADNANLIRLSAAFFGCLLCTLIYFFASPKSGMVSAARMLLPWANIAPATRVQFSQITPGATTIMQGSSIPINVTVKGLLKSEKVFLRYDLSDGQVRGQTIEMKEEIQGINYRLDFGKDFGGLHQPLTYWIHAGDAIAGPFDVGIQIVPLVAIDHIDLNYPSYTKLKPRTIQQQGHFEAPEGTVAQIHAIANQEMQSARLEFDPVLQNKLFLGAREFLEMKVDKTQLDANWTATIDRKNQIDKKLTTYRIHAVNTLKEANHDPIVYQIKVIPDLPPEVDFVGNSAVVVDVPIDQGILLEINARDPDYGLTSVEIQGATENKLNPDEPKILFRESLFQEQEDCPRSRNAQFTFLPLNHSLKVGDEIELIASAGDNYHNPTSQQLQPQRVYSQPLRVRIVDSPDPTQSNQENKNTDSPQEQPTIAENQNPQPKSRIDWDKYRKQQEANPSRTGSKSNPNDSPQNNQKQSDDESSPKSGQGGSDSDNTQSGNRKDPSDGQTSSSSGSANSQGNPAPENQQGTPSASSQPNADPNANQKPSQSNNKDSASNPQKQDKNAFDKIQQFMKERQGGNSQQSNGSPADDGSSKADPQTSNKPDDPGKPNNNPPSGNQPGESTEQSSGDPNQSNDPSDMNAANANQTGNEKSGADQNKTASPSGDASNANQKPNPSDKTGSDNAQSNSKESTNKQGADQSQNKPSPTSKNQNDGQSSGSDGSSKSSGESSPSQKPNPGKSNDPGVNPQNQKEPTGADPSDTKQAGNPQNNTDKTSPEKSGADSAGSNKSGSDKMGTEEGSKDQTGGEPRGDDSTGSNQPNGTDQSGNQQSSGNNPNNNKQGSDKSGSDKSGSDKSGSDKSGSDKSGSDKSGSDKSGSDKSGSDKSGSDKSGSDKSGSDKSGSDKSGSDKSGSDKSGSDKSGSDKSGSDKSGSDKSGSDKSGSDKSGSDKSGSDKSGSDKSGSDKSGSDKSGSDKSGSDKSGSDKSGSDKSGSDKSGSDKSGSDKSGSDKSGSDKSGSDKSGSDKESGPQANKNPQQTGDKKDPKAAPTQEQGEGQGSGDQEGGKQGRPNNNAPNSAGSGNNNTGKTPQSAVATGGGRSQSAEFGSEQANAEYSRKAGELLLDYIDRQRDQPDPELLKRLDWTAEDFRKFADRWKEAKEQAKLDPNKKAELDEALRNLGLAGTGQKINRLKDRNDGLRGMQEEGGRLPPPESLREQFEAFRKAAGKLGK